MDNSFNQTDTQEIDQRARLNVKQFDHDPEGYNNLLNFCVTTRILMLCSTKWEVWEI